MTDPFEEVIDGWRRVCVQLWSVRRLDRPDRMICDDVGRPVLATSWPVIASFCSRLAERGIDVAACPTSLLGIADELAELYPDDEGRDERLCLVEAQAESDLDAVLWAALLADRVLDRRRSD